MTTEITILNKSAIVIAADSASTVKTPRGTKIFTTANKIFKLHNDHKVGIMIYGSAGLMNVPWKVIISLYNDFINDQPLPLLKDYKDNFINFLKQKTMILFPSDIQNDSAKARISGFFLQIIGNQISNIIKINLANHKGHLSKLEYKRDVSKIIESEYNLWKNTAFSEDIDSTNFKNLREHYKDIVEEATTKFSSGLIIKLNQGQIKKLKSIAFWTLTKMPKERKTENSGFVIAGYGEGNIYPSTCVMEFEGIADNLINYTSKPGSDKIGISSNASLQAFAQRDMVITFMEGIQPEYQKMIEGVLKNLLTEYPKIIVNSLPTQITPQTKASILTKLSTIPNKYFADLVKGMKDFRVENYVTPVVSTISYLPQDELITLAEALVNLTSLKRRVSINQEETVGGPVDIAIIDREQGFVWIKNKTV